MKFSHIGLVTASMVAWAPVDVVVAQQVEERHMQIAEIEIDPAQLDAYKSAVAEHAEVALREEPGVLMLHVVSEKDNPSRIRVFEVYASNAAYRAHLEAPHFKKYKASTERMVKSLKLVQVTPVAVGSKLK